MLHHLENSRSQRIIWLLECLEIKYEVKHYKRDPKTNLAPKELLKVNPLGKSPCIEIDNDVLAESAAIIEYLLSRYDKENKFHPKENDTKFKDYLFWLHFAEGSLMGPLVTRLLHTKTKEKIPFFIRPIATLIFDGIEKAYLEHTINKMFEHIEETLAKNNYFLGDDFSAVDIMMSFPLEASVAGRVDMDKYPNILKYVKKLKSHSQYKKALEVGGDYIY